MPPDPKLRLKHYNSRSNAAPYYPLTTGSSKPAGQAPAVATNDKLTSATDKESISPTDAASDKTMEVTPDSSVRQRIRDIDNDLPFPPMPKPNATMRENSQRFLAHKYKEVDALINWRLGRFDMQSMRQHSNHFSKTPARLLKKCAKALMEEASIKTSPPTSPGGAQYQAAASSSEQATPSNDILFVVPGGLKTVRIDDLLKLVKESSNCRDEEYLDSYRARRQAFKTWREEINAAVENGELGFLDLELDAAVREQQEKHDASAASDLALKKER